MILPIVAYGDPVLKKKAVEVTQDHEGLSDLIANMFKTMDQAYGVGLAAPQIGKSLRLFVVDTTPFAQDEDYSKEEKDFLDGYRKVFINPVILEEKGNKWSFNEGCLSIPDVRSDVSRHETIVLQYQDEDFNTHTEEISGLRARVIQHEYDHIEGILFTDRISTLKKKLLKGKLSNVAKGKVDVDYRMNFSQSVKSKL